MKNKKKKKHRSKCNTTSPLSLSQGFICSLCLVSPWTLSLHLLLFLWFHLPPPFFLKFFSFLKGS